MNANLQEKGIGGAEHLRRRGRSYGEGQTHGPRTGPGENMHDDKDQVDATTLLEQSRRLLTEARQAERILRESVSFRLGSALVRATKSWKGLTALPGELHRISLSLKKRDSQQIHSLPKRATPPALQPETAARKLRVAAILDEFSHRTLAPECDLLQLHPGKWEKQLKWFNPDLLFIESAWEGENKAWHQKIALLSHEVRDLIAACNTRSLPTVFWNKEDPLSFGRFIELAGLVDYVFTTDIDSIPLYKWELGHERIFPLPFAAQPALHNPVETRDRKHAACFAGAYYTQYEERRRDFAALVHGVARHMPVVIYERRHGINGKMGAFPQEFAPMLAGSLSYADIDVAYKGYRWGINVNTERHSRSMFARRVWELLACNTPVLSNSSRGMRILLGDLVVENNNKAEFDRRVEALDDEAAYRKFRLAGLRKVMSEHTYKHRVDFVRAMLGAPKHDRSRPVAIVAKVQSTNDAEKVFASFRIQTHPNMRLFLFTTKSDVEYKALCTNVTCTNDQMETAKSALEYCGGDGAIGVFSPNDWYGPNYLTDLVIGFMYSGTMAVGKKTLYRADGNTDVALIEDGNQYRLTKAVSMEARAGLVLAATLDADRIKNWIESPETALLPDLDGLALDEFNYIRNGNNLVGNQRAVSVAIDIDIADTGINFR